MRYISKKSYEDRFGNFDETGNLGLNELNF